MRRVANSSGPNKWQERSDRPVLLEEDRAHEEPFVEMSDDQADKLLAIETAIKKLEKNNERQVRIIECKFFGGMTNDETAASLGISKATVKRDWATARAWLYREIQGDDDA